LSNKKELRKHILQIRDALSVEERKEKSRKIVEKVIHHREFQDCNTVLMFASYGSEVDTLAIFVTAKKMGKNIFFPKIVGEEMVFYQVNDMQELLEGYKGIREPAQDERKRYEPQLDERCVVLMPGVVFDTEGGRIGYGKGFYDKFLGKIQLERISKGFKKLAIAFECQLVETGEIMAESYDIKPDYIATENRLIEINKSLF